MKDIAQKTSCHSFAISCEPILCIPVEPQNNHILCLTSPSTQAVVRGVQPYDPSLCPCYIFLCQLPTVNHECSSGLEAVGFHTIWGFYAGGQRSCDWGKEIFTSFFPVAVLWALSIWTPWFNLQCLTPSVICSVVLRQIWYSLHGKDMRFLLNLGMKIFCFCIKFRVLHLVPDHNLKWCCPQLSLFFMQYADYLGPFWSRALVTSLNAMGGWTQNPLLLDKSFNCSGRAIKGRSRSCSFVPQELELLRGADLRRWPGKRIQKCQWENW